MAVKLRLQRHGKKDNVFFHIVVADGRAPRDGKFIEKIGTYNPGTNPATIDLNFEKALNWLDKGAQPTDTCRAILKYKGVLLRKHLNGGIKKGALTQDQADAKFNKWVADKDNVINKKKDTIQSGKSDYYKKRMEAEKAANEARMAKLAAKNTPAPVAEAAPETPAAEQQAEG